MRADRRQRTGRGRSHSAWSDAERALEENSRSRCPTGPSISSDGGRPRRGLRFVDLDEDGRDDVVFSNDEGYGVYLFDSMTNGWTRQVPPGKAGDPSGPAEDRPRNGTRQRLLGPLAAASGGRTRTPPSLPDLVDRRSFNDLLKDVEPRGKSPAASRRRSASARVQGRAGGERAAGARPDRLRLGGRRPALGRRDGRLPARHRRQGEAGRARPRPRRHRRRRPLRQGDRLPRRPRLPDRPDALAERRARRLRPDIFYAEDSDGDGKADHPRGPLHRASARATSSTGSTASTSASTAGSTAPTATAAASIRSLKTGKTVDISGRDFRFRPDDGEFEAESGQTQYGRHRDDWGHWFGNNNPNLGLALRPRRRRPPPQPAVRRPRPAPDARARHRGSIPSAGPSPGSTTPTRPTASPRPTARRPTATTSSAPTSRTASSSASRSTTSSTGWSSSPTAPTFARPSRGRTRPTASSSPRATTGSGRRCSRPAPTARSGSPTCTAPSSSTPNGSPTTGRRSSTSAPAATRAGSTASIPVDKTPRPIPRLDRLDTAGPRRRARQPQRLAARHRAAPPAPPERRRPRRRAPAALALRDARTRRRGCRPSGRSRTSAGSPPGPVVAGPGRPAPAGPPERRRGWLRACSPATRTVAEARPGAGRRPRRGRAVPAGPGPGELARPAGRAGPGTPRPPRRGRPLVPRGGPQLGPAARRRRCWPGCSTGPAARRTGWSAPLFALAGSAGGPCRGRAACRRS